MKAVLVRHAHAGDRDRWEGPDDLRPLSEKGWAQARRLADELAPLRPARLLSSPYVRCLQTLEPLAERLSLPLEADDRLAEGASPDKAFELLMETGAAACTHGDVMADIIERLWRSGIVEKPAWSKGGAWVLDVEDGRVTGARYLAP